MNNNPNILTNVFGYDEQDVEFERIVNNLDDYEVSPRDIVGYALNRKRVIVPYVFAQFGVRLF